MVVRLQAASDPDSASVRSAVETKSEVSFKQKVYMFIMFMPFNSVWEVLIQISIMTTVGYTVYKSYWNKYIPGIQFTIVYYAIELFYLTDTIASYMHRYMKDLNKFALHTPRHLILLTIDSISLIPIFEFYYLLQPELAQESAYYISLKSILRMVHLMFFIFRKRALSDIQHLCLMIISHNIFLLFLTMIMSIVWSWLSTRSEPNWSRSLPYFDIDRNNIHDWFALNFNFIANIILHNWGGFLIDTNMFETSVLIFCLLSGFISHIIIESGHLTKCMVQALGRRFDYMQLMDTLNWIVKDWDVDMKSRKKISDFYTVLWQKRNGIVVTPKSIELLPISLKKEVCLDIFWEAMRHSHLFANLEVCVRKELAMVMTSEFLLPGDYLLKAGKIRNRMIYIVSGIVELLSTEDDLSPILTFSGGTLLGEISCFMNLTCGHYVRCATDCEIHVLDLASVARISMVYKHHTEHLARMVAERIYSARLMMRDRKKAQNYGTGYSNTMAIYRLKKQWRYISRLDNLAKHRKMLDNKMFEEVDLTFYSEFLDLLVLSDRTNKVSTVCARDRCSYVMEPTSSFRLFWGYFHLAAVILQTVLTPYFVAFHDGPAFPTWYRLIMIIVDDVYLCDLYIQAITAYRIDNVLYTDPITIILYRLKCISFLVDIVATIPFDYITAFLDFDIKIQRYSKIPRVLKCYKIIEFLMKMQKNSMYYFFMIFLKYTSLYLLFLYICSCITYMIFCFGHLCVDKGIRADSPLGGDNRSKMSGLSCILFNIYLLMGLSLSGRTVVTRTELYAHTILGVIGAYLYNFFLCELTATLIKLNEKIVKYNNYHKLINNFMTNKCLPTTFRSLAASMYTFQWYNNKNVEIRPNKNKVYVTLEQNLMTERIVAALKSVPIFQNYDSDFLHCVAKYAIARTLPPDTVICTANEKSLHLHIINRGYCRCLLKMPGDIQRKSSALLQKGDCFPVLEIFQNVDSLNTVYTLTAVEEFCIPAFELRKVFQTRRKEFQCLNVALEWHMQKYKTILTQQNSSTDRKMSKMNKGDIFEYEISDKDEVVEISDRHKFGPFKLFMMKKTIDPCGKFFITWEAFRSTLAYSYFLTHIYYHHHVELIYIFDIWINCVRLILIIDIYICLHLRYYNEKNILVTDTFWTTKNYINHAALSDAVAAFPFYDLKLDKIYSRGYYSLISYYDSLFYPYIFTKARPIQGLTNLQKYLKGWKGQVLQILKIVGLYPFMDIILNNVVFSTCIQHTNGTFDCTATENFITRSPFNDTSDTWNFLRYVSYAMSTRFHASLLGISDFEMTGNPFEGLFMLYFLWCVKIVVIATITASSITGNILVIKYRKRMINFLAYVENELVSEEAIQDCVEHFEYVWKRSDGIIMKSFLNTFFEKLQVDIKTYLFKSTLLHSYFFHDASIGTCKVFIDNLEILYFKRSAEIIRCNDIQGTLYFVLKGAVDIKVAGHIVATLKQGGIFGSLAKRGLMRQTITAVAKYHVEILAIKSELFHQLIQLYPVVSSRVHNLAAFGYEYMKSYEPDVNRATINAYEEKKSGSHVDVSFHSRLKLGRRMYLKKINEFVRSDAQSYKTCLYILNVHIAPMSCLILLLMNLTYVRINYISVYLCLVDTIFIVHMFLSFHLYYVDPESGVQIKDAEKIRNRYAKSFMFWIDLIGTLPLNLVLIAIGVDESIIRISAANRLLRGVHLYTFYSDAKKKLYLSISLQWTYMLYLVSFAIITMSLFWNFLACPSKVCTYRQSSGPYYSIHQTKDERWGILLSVLYVVNVFTSCGLGTVIPTTVHQLIMSQIFIVISVTTIGLMLGTFTGLLVINGITWNQYQKKISELVTFAKDRGLSIVLVDKIHAYMLNLWTIRRGELIPLFVKEAPPYLREKVMCSIYGYHLRNSVLFRHTHTDFLRQLTLHLQVWVYPTGQIIVEKGDIDESMYFIHKGEVKVIDMEHVEILQSGTSFGVKQGILASTHIRTYLAYTTADILILKKSEWEYLLDWFPASKDIIFSTLTNVETDSWVSMSPSATSMISDSLFLQSMP